MNLIAQDGRGSFLCVFLDFHAAGGAGHEDDATGGAVDEQPEIKFALDVETLFDEQALDDAAAGPGLRSDQLHAENLAGEIGGFVGRTRQVYAASFAAATSVDFLCFDHDIDL